MPYFLQNFWSFFSCRRNIWWICVWCLFTAWSFLFVTICYIYTLFMKFLINIIVFACPCILILRLKFIVLILWSVLLNICIIVHAWNIRKWCACLLCSHINFEIRCYLYAINCFVERSHICANMKCQGFKHSVACEHLLFDIEI